ncbi:MAG: hypothetical protein ACYTFG_06300 [Planctomycetota bacterium]|jgi:hypothetical protein
MKFFMPFFIVAVVGAGLVQITGVPGSEEEATEGVVGPDAWKAEGSGFGAAVDPTAETEVLEVDVFEDAEEEVVEGRASDPIAFLDEVEIRGKVVRRSDGFYSDISFENPTASPARVKVHFGVFRTDPGSSFGRMGPVPQLVKTHLCEVTVPAASKLSKRLFIRKHEVASAKEADSEKSEKAAKTWSLHVSRSTVEKGQGWGALIPSTKENRIALEKGRVILSTERLMD